MPAGKTVGVGDRLPSFELEDADGAVVDSADVLGRGPVVLYFYPRDNTLGCTAQACAFRDAYEDFLDAGAQVIGVSRDTTGSHRAFADKHRLPFQLLSDPGGRLRAAMGVPKTAGTFDGRVTYVIDRAGVIRDKFSSQVQVGRHVRNALALVRRLAAADDAASA